MVTVIPELTLGFQNFTVLGFDFDEARLFTGRIGTRIRFLRFVEPGIYSHLGLGRLIGDLGFCATGVAFDVGATLDLSVIHFGVTSIDVGFHLSWNRIFGGFGNGFAYVLAGAHIEFVF
jgi:hypothetical protein